MMNERQRASATTRLAAQFAPIPECGCSIWTGPLNRNGYGKMFHCGRAAPAHRVAWELAHGPIPQGLFVCHRCDVRCCINVNHLFLGTARDNYDDMRRKGRSTLPYYRHEGFASGVSHYNAKLTWEIVTAIRADNRSPRRIAADYGLAHSHVANIKAFNVWREKP